MAAGRIATYSSSTSGVEARVPVAPALTGRLGQSGLMNVNRLVGLALATVSHRAHREGIALSLSHPELTRVADNPEPRQALSSHPVGGASAVFAHALGPTWAAA
jgi:hypothetical protein